MSVLDARLTLTAQCARLEQTLPEHDDGDHLVKNVAELVATTHVADGHVTGTDHAEQLAHLSALLIMRKLAQSIQSICTAAAVTTWTVHSEHVHEAGE